MRKIRKPGGRSLAAGRRLRDLAPAGGLLFVSAVGAVAAGLSPSARNGQYAVMAPPWYTQAQTIGLIARAGGELVDVGGMASVVIAHSARSGFVPALYGAGAWLVVDPARLGGCLGFARTRTPAPGGV